MLASSDKGRVSLVTETPPRFYRPGLDVVRFSAFTLVYLHHAFRTVSHLHPSAWGAWTGTVLLGANTAGFGLSLFFALSAYLIAELLMREQDRTGTVHMRAFYTRRILRIWPLYLIGIAIGVAMALWRHTYSDLPMFGAMALLAGNWWRVFRPISASVMSPLWSISVEEQFYLLWPPIARLVRRRNLLMAALMIAVVSCASLVYLGARHTDVDKVWANSFPQFLMFAAGIVLAIVTHSKRMTLAAIDRISLIAASLCVWLVACRFCHVARPDFAVSGLNLLSGYLLIALGCVGVIVAALDAGPFPSWLLYLGRISYGLYVFHLLGAEIMRGILQRLHPPMLEACIYIAGFALTVGIASVSYRFFEQPFLRWKDSLAVIHTTPGDLPREPGSPDSEPISAKGPAPDVSEA